LALNPTYFKISDFELNVEVFNLFKESECFLRMDKLYKVEPMNTNHDTELISRDGKFTIDEAYQLFQNVPIEIAIYDLEGCYKYVNKHYGFPVMTAQEKELLLNAPVSIKATGDNEFEVLYADEPQPVFCKDWEAEFAKLEKNLKKYLY